MIEINLIGILFGVCGLAFAGYTLGFIVACSVSKRG